MGDSSADGPGQVPGPVPRVQFRLLGPVDAVDETGRVLPVAAPRHRALLAALLVDAGTVVSVDRLTDLLWEGRPPPTARTMVHGGIAALRRAWGQPADGQAGPLLTRGGGYLVSCPDERLDVARFRQLLAEGRRLLPTAPGRAAGVLAEALALWRGAALSGIDQTFAREAAGRWEEERLDCAEARISAELALGHHAQIVPELAELAGAHPFREGLQAALAVALYRAGRQAEALAAVRSARRALAEELGLRPGPELRWVERAVLEQSQGLDRSGPPPGTPPAGRALPSSFSGFVGRTRECADVTRLLGAHRLVTLTGPGGSGKSRVAQETAVALLRHGSTEVCFADLSPLTTPGLLAETVAEALGIRTGSGRRPVDVVAAALSGRTVLLLLDNCEHLAGACAGLLGPLLAAAPGLRLLVTSREALHLPGEQRYGIQPLPLAATGEDWQRIAACDAVRLFAERLSAGRAGFAVTPANADVVVEICRRLDGLPLALELAAARAASLSLDDLAERLDDRFGLLDGVTATPDRRHRTLTAALAWSSDLLPAEQRELFARVSVFPAPFTLTAAEGVTSGTGLGPAEIGHLLADLVATSTVQLAEGPDGRTRFRMLETTRQFARGRLDGPTTAELRRRHAGHYAHLADEVLPSLFGRASGPQLALLHAEHDHFRAALEWAFSPGGDALLGAGLVGCLWHAWDLRGARGEGLHWVHAGLLQLGPDAVSARLPLLSAGALFHLGRAEFEQGAALAREQLELARATGARSWEGDALRLTATAAWVRGEFDRAQHLYEDAVSSSLAGDDVWRASLAESLLARLHRDRDEPDAARAAVLRAHRHAGDTGEGLARGLAVDVLASLEHRWGDPATARDLVDEALACYRTVGYLEGEVSALQLRGQIDVAAGRPGSAQGDFERSLLVCRRIGLRAGVAAALEGLADVAARGADDERALQLLGAAAALRERIGAPLTGAAGRGQRQELDRLMARVGPVAAARATRRGADLDLDALAATGGG